MQARSSSNQIDLIRRYARILRQEAAQHRGPRIAAGPARFTRDAAARQARFTRGAAEAALGGAETAARAALQVVRPTEPSR